MFEKKLLQMEVLYFSHVTMLLKYIADQGPRIISKQTAIACNVFSILVFYKSYCNNS